MTTITLNVSDELLAKLQSQATQHDMALEAYITSALSDVVDDEPTKEQVLNAIKEGILAVERGELGRPIHEVLDELEQEEAETHANYR
ncbi:MAG: hypothetical protein MUE54_14190 [Anaerolineae bacterium]|jgi:predicted transcriptional regulator|nr:hypothetical protein [Anaerolineae bacterium]